MAIVMPAVAVGIKLAIGWDATLVYLAELGALTLAVVWLAKNATTARRCPRE